MNETNCGSGDMVAQILIMAVNKMGKNMGYVEKTNIYCVLKMRILLEYFGVLSNIKVMEGPFLSIFFNV